MKLYIPTVDGSLRIYTLQCIDIKILSEDYMTILFGAEDDKTGIIEYLTYTEYEKGEFFIDRNTAQERASINILEFYKEKL